jgi:hypothetical protein
VTDPALLDLARADCETGLWTLDPQGNMFPGSSWVALQPLAITRRAVTFRSPVRRGSITLTRRRAPNVIYGRGRSRRARVGAHVRVDLTHAGRRALRRRSGVLAQITFRSQSRDGEGVRGYVLRLSSAP